MSGIDQLARENIGLTVAFCLLLFPFVKYAAIPFVRGVLDELKDWINTPVYRQLTEEQKQRASEIQRVERRVNKLVYGVLRCLEASNESHDDAHAKCFFREMSGTFEFTYPNKPKLENEYRHDFVRYPAGDRREKGPFGHSSHEPPDFWKEVRTDD